MATLAFAVLALVAVASALGLVLKRNPVHGALFLVVNLASIAAFYLTLGAEFLAAAQVIVYAGAIMVLIPGKEETGPDPRRAWRTVALPAGLLLFLVVAGTALGRLGTPLPVAPAAADNVGAIARALFSTYLYPFELTSVLLLVAMVGVLLLARRRA